ncbi:hypothetical protein HA402_013342 [Bradysia odoriphaga]|nr:hypothetical protein HA402_013342 [Bradysia odoriphaga]
MDQRELRMNIVAIKRVDPYAKDIVDSSAHVAFYTFNKEEEEWEKTDVEGAFFIYSRNAEPYHSVFINNRLNTKSLVEPITAQIELQIEAPFMLYRNERSRTRCFWFYNKAECERIGTLVERIIQSSDKNSNYKDISFLQHSQQMNKNVDIFSMLTKAQEDFNNSVAGIPSVPAAGMSTTLPNKFPDKNQTNPDVTSQSVMNFFAAAKPAAPKEVPFFQRMLSQPVHVDQIEKQQRTVTPHDKNNSPPQESINIPNPSTGVENGSGATFMRIHSPNHPPEFGTSPFANFLSSSNRPPAPTANTTDVSELELRQKPLQALLKKTGEPITGQSKPALMLPTMFAVTQNSVDKGGRSGAEPLASTLGQLEQASVVPGKPEPLTQSQLLQAMSYLIKNDTDFVKKLHEAYLKSFTEMVSL